MLSQNQFSCLTPCITHTVESAKCLGIWWQHNLMATRAVQENITKARRAFFALGDMGAFQGSLNPWSALSIYESYILPILLYGSETWLLDSTTIAMLDRFQIEIGRHIFQLPSFASNSVVCLCLCCPCMTSRILIRKLTYLAKLLTSRSDKRSISCDIFSLICYDIWHSKCVPHPTMYNVGIRKWNWCFEVMPGMPRSRYCTCQIGQAWDH